MFNEAAKVHSSPSPLSRFSGVWGSMTPARSGNMANAGITDAGYSSGKRANGRVNDSAEHCADSYQSDMKSSDTMATTPFQRAITNLNKNPSKPLPSTTDKI